MGNIYSIDHIAEDHIHTDITCNIEEPQWNGEIYMLSTYDPEARNHNNGNIYRLVDPAVTAEQIETCRSKQKGLDLNKTPKTGLSIEQIISVVNNNAGASVGQVHVDTAASEVDATISEVDTRASDNIAASEVDTTVDTTTTTAGEVDTTVDTTTTTAGEVGTNMDTPITTAGEVDTTVDGTTTTVSEVDITGSEEATATQGDLSDTLQEEINEPVITSDENNVDNNIVPIVGETQAITDTALENIIEQLIDGIEYKVIVKLFPFGSIRTVIGLPDSPEAAETTLDDSNSSEDDSRNSSDDDDD